MQVALFLSIFFIAVSGLVYELVCGTLASYLLGDSVLQFSTIIGTYLFAMGIGSWLSRYVTRNLVATFVRVEIMIGVFGGSAAAALFLLFENVRNFRVPLYGAVLLIGILVGLEMPLVMRLLKQEVEFKDLVAKVFTFDYVGALLASLLFPLLLVPHLGLVRTCFLFGMVNVAVALWSLHVFQMEGRTPQFLRGTAIAALIFLGLGFGVSDRILDMSEEQAFPDPVVMARTTPYQRLVITKGHSDLRLFINGNLQFSSRDEYRYHEALVHPGLASVGARGRILVLGGGDGLAVREILRYPDVEHVTLVDLDPAMTAMFKSHPPLIELNQGSLTSPKVQIINADAFSWLRETKGLYDFVVIDFPDPSSYALGKLYSTAFYRALAPHLAVGAAFVVQSTSPLVARRSFWCVVNTMEAAGFATVPYHALVPSFGEWGYVLGSVAPLKLSTQYVPGLKFLSPETLATMLEFPRDMARLDAEVNRLNNQALVHLFEEEWAEYLR